MRLVSWISFALFSFHLAAGQRQLSFSFQHYTTSDGLISNQVNTVVQDADGFLWIGTTGGLQRYDGVRFKTFRYKPAASGALPSNQVLSLSLDKMNRLWVLMADGRIGIFDTDRFIYQDVSYLVPNEEGRYAVGRKLIMDDLGNIFLILQNKELLIWNERKNEFSQIQDYIPLMPEWKVESFVQQPGSTKYYIGLRGGGIAEFDASTEQLSYAGQNIAGESIIDYYSSLKTPYNLHVDQCGRLWFMEWPTNTPLVYCWDIANKKPIIEKVEFSSTLQSYVEAAPFFEQKDGTIWVYGMKLLARYDEDHQEFEYVEPGNFETRGYEHRNITSLFEDREQNIWVSTSSSGLFRFNPREQFFRNIDHKNPKYGKRGDGSVLSFASLKDGCTLVGIWGDGLFKYDGQWNELPLKINGFDNERGSIWSIAASADNNTIWMAGQPAIIWRFDQDLSTARLFSPSVLEQRTIRQIVEDDYGNLWLGMHGLGLFRWTPTKGSQYYEDRIERIHDIPNCNINKITKDSKGLIWVATSDQGLYAIDPYSNSIKQHLTNRPREENRLPEAGVSSVMEYTDTSIIIGTSSYLLLYQSNSSSLSQLASPESITGYITSLERDNQGYVWMGTTNGIYRINVSSRSMVKFDQRDGIENDESNLAASHQMPDGRILIGTSERFISFQPADIVFPSDSLKISITEINVMNRPLNADSLLKSGLVKLKTKQNALTIDYSTLTYNSQYRVSYKMEGLDEDWIANENYSAVYSHLPPGNYRFRLQVFDAEGIAQNNTELKIIVSPPFWKMWWFYSVTMLTLAGLLFWYDRDRMRRKELMHQMRIDIAGNLHKEVNLALNNINILSEMAHLKAHQDTDKANEYIKQINSKSHNMIVAMEDMLWAIRPENDHLEKVVDRLREYVQMLQSRPNIQVLLTSDKKVGPQKLDMKMRQMMLRLFKGGITNVIKAGGKDCHIHIGMEKTIMTYTIEFDSSVIDKQLLYNMLQRRELAEQLKNMNGKFQLAQLGENITITFTVPLHESY